MPDIFDLLTRWWKQVLFIVILATTSAGIACFMQPKLYKAEATAIAGSAYNMDKSRIFSENLQSLYSSLGSPDDLDRIIGTAKLDTVYFAAAERLRIWDHIGIKNNTKDSKREAVEKLRSRVNVKKTAYGELLVQAWDKDPAWAARIANEVLLILDEIHQSLQRRGNEVTLQSLWQGKEKLERKTDSMTDGSIQPQLDQYDKLIAQYQLLVDSKPPVLLPVEHARAAIHPDKPRMIRTMAATAFLSFLFALALAAVLHYRSQKANA